ncbi:MAG: exodeoxyribonuclease VII large subunit [Verrucomicrobia bacterium]|nr:exodeoxyribonuclease VII large subunit [Verrucomicrobiota bacterium]MCG2679931.1 exodeoxyribonuclease VII large subunit [Kiritimatiellia bacterium]MBU4247275.1 exodeoxyribonuclease VII large subunit [Verrucomicrobiota bacterium]MBU4290556.1 exodeoxyribonuclease VII large subunit [Verrucomicrobiota bacterium]MBU4428516.1 exodeoxyribonuclease VII large subunit [Verrucomicrobiota bacterium]
MPQPKIYRVAEITRLIKTVLEDEVGEIWIEGELSNFRKPSSGHCYFTLKDAAAQIAAVMFRGNQRNLQFQPADGMMVRVFGQVSVYEKSGQYQVIVRQIILSGQGALQAAFEALKKKLADEGLFDPSRKKPLPLLPRHIGIVTSPTGAAIRDILNILTRRFPNLHIVLAPVRVQGAGAGADIAAAIDALNAWGGLEVLIVGRGGGSLEDLWCFNEEIVARAIARSALPIISAVGHEIDFTISDFVADLRAPTPSAAAELVVREKAEFEAQLRESARRLARSLQQQFLGLQHRLLAVSRSHVFREPAYVAQRYRDRIDRLGLQMRHGLENIFRERQQITDDLSLRLVRQMREWQRLRAMDIKRLALLLNGINPLAVLDRGYSITCRQDGGILKDAGQVTPGAKVVTRLSKGTFESEVV